MIFMRKRLNYSLSLITIHWIMPLLLCLTTIGAYVKINKKFLDIADLMTALEIFDSMRGPIVNLPEKIIQLEISNISNKTKSLIINFFQTLFFAEKQIDNLRMNYFYKRDFSPFEEFIQLRGNNKKAQHITKVMLASFLENNLSEEDKKELLQKPKIEAIFNRIDKDEDLLISYTDFILSIEPFCSNV